MDIVAILQQRLDAITEGPYTIGLAAIVQHIEAAVRHWERGKKENEDTLFTDAIYRTNQAFEGSLKEAYRVLAQRDPDHTRPYDIENYFADKTILRHRVLDQLSSYRKDWRNPSTHDYKLDFDEDEALLAIVTVCAFAIVLFDQIAEHLSFLEAQKATANVPKPADSGRPLLDLVAAATMSFRLPTISEGGEPREVEVVGALAGFLSNQLAPITTQSDIRPVADRAFTVDLGVLRGSEQVLVEVKTGRPGPMQVRNGINQLAHYLALGGTQYGLLFFFSPEKQPNYQLEEHALPGLNGRIVIITPPQK